METLSPTEWIAKCAERLHDRWRAVPSAELEEVAIELWRDPTLRARSPAGRRALAATDLRNSLTKDITPRLRRISARSIRIFDNGGHALN
jgi:hypothetical protein